MIEGGGAGVKQGGREGGRREDVEGGREGAVEAERKQMDVGCKTTRRAREEKSRKVE